MFKWLFGRGKDDDGGSADVGGTAEIIVISRRVPGTPAETFARFVDRLADWWPRDLTWAGENLDTIAIEPTIRGRAFERDKAGNVSVWGSVLTVKRPEHIVLAWQIKQDRTPEASESTSSRVDIRFVAIDPETTEVVVVHRDFPRHGDGWQSYKAAMASKKGWPRLIEAFAKAT
jgi:uncharacterized protein YndB with AHSA1/START domain